MCWAFVSMHPLFLFNKQSMTRKDDAPFQMHRLYLLDNMFGKQARYIYVSGVYACTAYFTNTFLPFTI